ncbi:MAG: lysophospholipid acyltransferase family protein [Jatrophihabitantaceae bacterium]
MTDPSLAQFRHGSFAEVRRWGPTLLERVHGSARLRRLQRASAGVCTALGRLQLSGIEQLPAEGPVILAVNHTSAWDGALLFGAVRRPVSFLVKVEAFQPAGGLVGRLLIAGAQLPVRRHRIDPAPVRLSVQLLDRGGVVGICPEGRRGDGSVTVALPGVGYLAIKTGAVVVPVAIHGSTALVRRRGWRRPVVRIALGPPMSFPSAGPGPINRGRWLAATEQIRTQLAELVRSTAPEFGSRNPHIEKVD